MFLLVQGLGLLASKAGGTGSIPVWGTGDTARSVTKKMESRKMIQMKLSAEQE